MRGPGRWRAPAALGAAAVLLAGCQLDRNVLYHCDDAGPQCQPGATCQADGFCHWDPETGCTPLGAAAACAGGACGWADAGCGQEVDCGAWCPPGLECGVAAPGVCGVPHLCSPSGWCWENPLPLGMGYQVLRSLGPRQVWLGGEQGVAFFDGQRTSLTGRGLQVAGTVLGLAVPSASEVYAVGTGGLVAHLVDGGWRREDAGTTATLRAVEAAPGGTALAAGDEGVLRLRSAATGAWAPPATAAFPGQDFVALATLSTGETVLGTAQGLLVWRTGPQAFELREPAPLAGVRALAALGPRLYLAGAGPGRWLSRREPDGGWTALLEDLAGAPLEALAVDGEDLWVVGAGLVQRWARGEVPGPALAPEPSRLRAAAPVRPGELLAGGEDGALVVAWADGGVAARSRGPTGAVTALCAAPGRVLAATACEGAACTAAVLERPGHLPEVGWSQLASVPDGGLRTVTACSLEDAARGWLTSDSSRWLRWDGAGLQPGDFGVAFAGPYSGVWGQAGAGYHFVRQPAGRKGELLSSPDGVGGFAAALRGSGARAVWGVASARWVGVVGDNGFWSELDAQGTWSTPAAPALDALRALHASPLADGGVWWVAAGEGALWTRLGSQAPEVEHLPGAQLQAAWSSAASGAAFAAGEQGGAALLVRRDPGDGGWVPVPLGLGRPVSALTGLDDPFGGRVLFLGGDGGMLLRLPVR